MYKIVFTKTAAAQVANLKAAKLDGKVKALLDIIRNDPLAVPPPCEKLKGDLTRAYSRRINIKHRLVYEILEEEKTVKILSMWTHYDF